MLRKKSDSTKYYEILGVPNSASRDDFKKVYPKPATNTNPDKGGDPVKENFTCFLFMDLLILWPLLGDCCLSLYNDQSFCNFFYLPNISGFCFRYVKFYLKKLKGKVDTVTEVRMFCGILDARYVFIDVELTT